MKPYSWWSAMKHFQAHQEPLCFISIRDHLHNPKSESLLRKCRLSSCNHCTNKNSVYLKLVGCCLSVCVESLHQAQQAWWICGLTWFVRGVRGSKLNRFNMFGTNDGYGQITPDLAHAWLTDHSHTCHVDAMARSKAIFINSHRVPLKWELTQ